MEIAWQKSNDLGYLDIMSTQLKGLFFMRQEKQIF